MTVLFINPVKEAKLTSTFGYRILYGGREFHYGIDLAKGGNVPILAAADGVVVKRLNGVTSYGNVVFINHRIEDKEMETVYAHLKSTSVKIGDVVKQGDIIGYMGNTDGGTGRSTGQHLHFEVHEGKWISGRKNAVDPYKWIDKKPTAKQTPVVVVSNKNKTLHLPKNISSWAVYPTDKQPVKKNAKGYLNPKKFGGLKYEILGNPQKDVYTIKTTNFGKVNIYAAKSTGANIK